MHALYRLNLAIPTMCRDTHAVANFLRFVLLNHRRCGTLLWMWASGRVQRLPRSHDTTRCTLKRQWQRDHQNYLAARAGESPTATSCDFTVRSRQWRLRTYSHLRKTQQPQYHQSSRSMSIQNSRYVPMHLLSSFCPNQLMLIVAARSY